LGRELGERPFTPCTVPVDVPRIVFPVEVRRECPQTQGTTISRLQGVRLSVGQCFAPSWGAVQPTVPALLTGLRPGSPSFTAKPRSMKVFE